MVKFAALNYLWLFWILPVLLVLSIWATRKRRKILSKVIDPILWNSVIPEISKSKRGIKYFILILSLVFLILALIRPQWGYHLQEIKRKGVDLTILVDVSDSMRAEDIRPNRIERAKRELVDLVQILQGDRIGLIPFAGRSYIACPLTSDYSTFELFIEQLDTDLIPVQGTDIAGALHKALGSFDLSALRSKAIILITDGEATQGNLEPMMNKLKEEEVRLFVIGMGSEEGAPIPLIEGNGFKKDRKGEVVISKLNESSLKDLALKTGGSYVRSVTGDLDLQEIYIRGVKHLMEETEIKSGQKLVPDERFQIPLFIGFILLLIEFIFIEHRRVNKFDD